VYLRKSASYLTRLSLKGKGFQIVAEILRRLIEE